VYYVVWTLVRIGSAGIETQIDRIGAIPPSRRFYAAFPVSCEKILAFHTFHIHFRLLFAAFRLDEDRATVRGIIRLPE